MQPVINTAASPIPSATLILVRDGLNGLEIYMVLRHNKSDFAAGALVFPGGKIDKNDKLTGLRRFCDGAEALDNDELCMCIAAIRETFEECGILLARPKGATDIVPPDRVVLLEHYRDKLNQGGLTLKEFLEAESLRLACDQLIPWAHWIAPVHLPVRFSTRFFLAKTPPGQAANHDGSEAVGSIWATPQRAIADADRGTYFIMFPTRMNLLRLAESNTVSDAIRSAKSLDLVTIMPVIKQGKTGPVLSIPQGVGYRVTKAPVDLKLFQNLI